TKRGDIVETQFGVAVADPHRWLENDVRNDAEVAAWVESQNLVTNAFLDTLPLQESFKKRLTELYDYERFGVPTRKGGRYFYTHNTGLQNQSVLFARDSLDGEGRQLIDPNAWSKDGATALAEWTPSEDGKLLAYSIQDGGTDWRIVRVMDVATGKLLGDELKWLKYGGDVAWTKDGKGFYYSRFPEPKKGQDFQETSLNQSVWFHKLGTPQSTDRKIFATPDLPKRGHSAVVSDDGRWLVIYTGEGTDNVNEIRIVDLKKSGAKPRALITGLDHEWSYLGNQGTRFLFRTNDGAPLKKIVAIDVAKAKAEPQSVVAEQKSVIDDAGIVGDKLVVTYLADARSEAKVFTLDGAPAAGIELPGIGTAGGLSGKMGEDEAFFYFTSFNRPTTVYRYDAASGAVTPWAAPKVAFSPDDFTVEQRFYNSKDGTKVPMFIVRKQGSIGPAPTLLYGYGGFDISLTPAFSAANLAWVDAGGTYVVANIRG
ncbi:MAG: prolyl oligopeptidase family serine peptidase, partial [Sphingomicrobium sp.]